MQRIVSTVVALALLFSAAPLAAQESVLPYHYICENGTYRLYLDYSTTMFYLENAQTGARFYSAPPDWEDDEFAKGQNKQLIPSLIAIDAYNDKNVPKTYVSYKECVEPGLAASAYKITKLNNGFRVRYRFDGPKIELDVVITLEEGGFRATVPNASIAESGAEKLGQIKLLPFFSAGRPDEGGYLFVPDGCGALIDFDGVFAVPNELSRSIYGRDAAILNAVLPNPEQAYRMPVFGVKRGEQAHVGIVEGGQYTSQIRAAVAGDNSRYFRAFSTMSYRDIQTILMFENSADEKSVQLVLDDHAEDDFSVRYLLVEGGDADYSGMARAYREKLIAEGSLVPQKIACAYLDVTLYGAIQKMTRTLGVPHSATASLTTLPQALDIARQAKDAGSANLALTLAGFHSAGTKYRFTGALQIDRHLGGERELRALIDEPGVGVTIAAELIEVYANSNGYNASRDAARSVSDGPAYLYPPNLITRRRNYLEGAYSLLSPKQVERRMEDYVRSTARYPGLRVLPMELGTRLYGDYASRDPMPRDRAGNAFLAAARVASGPGLTIDSGNAYLFPYVSRVQRAPMAATGFDLETRQVPFYQMVLKGVVPYSGDSLNRQADPDIAFLRMVEYGANPAMEWFYAPSETVYTTKLNDVLSGHYANWLDGAARAYAAAAAVCEATGGSKIFRHDALAEAVARVTYENGARVYVNYSNADIEFDGVLIPAMGYVIGGSGR